MVTAGIHVAIVDDDLSVRKALNRLLAAASFRIQTFASAHDFLESLKNGLPDCLVLDIHMPGLSGLDLHSHLRDTNLVVPTIIITAFDDAEKRARCSASGAAVYLTKPLDGPTLIRAIETVSAAVGRGRQFNGQRDLETS
jgi:FixJ family two-component response regulator